jgi:hypothetical protein
MKNKNIQTKNRIAVGMVIGGIAGIIPPNPLWVVVGGFVGAVYGYTSFQTNER